MNRTIQLINKIFLKINNISENKLSGNIDQSAILVFAHTAIGFILLYPVNWLELVESFLLGGGQINKQSCLFDNRYCIK